MLQDIEEGIAVDGAPHAGSPEGGQQNHGGGVDAGGVQHGYFAGQLPTPEVLVVHINIDVCESVFLQVRQLLTVEIEVMVGIEGADIHTIVKVFFGDVQIRRCEVCVFATRE